MLIAVHFHAVPTAVRNHDRTDARRDGRAVGRQIKPAQRRLVAHGVALVHAVGRAAVANEMFRAGEHRRGRGGQLRPLKPLHRGEAQFRHQRGMVAVTFVGAPPAFVLRHGDARREGPADARAGDLLGGDAFGAFHQPGIMRGPQADMMGENHRALDVVVPVDGVNSVNQRNFQPGLARLRLEFRDELQPVLRRVARGGVGITAAQDGAEEIFPHVRLVLERAGIHLDHLADFLVQRHLRQQRVHLPVMPGKQRCAPARQRREGD